MRKRLDEEMPERALFFWFKRGLLLAVLVLLSLGVFLLVRRKGKTAHPAAGGTIVRTIHSGHSVDGRREGGVADRGKGEEVDQQEGGAADRGKKEVTDQGKDGFTDQRKREAVDQQQGRVTDRRKREMADQQKEREGSAQNKDRSNAGADNERTGMVEPHNARKGNAKTKDPQRAVIDSRLAQTGTQVAIRLNVDMPRGTAGKGKKNARKPEQSQKPATKPATEDSTRILWAAGLQDSKSFPVGAQQAYNYDANLKKDIWADYIPSPYFQYHISRRIAFQTALQLNNPQYTESVTIFRKAGDSSGGVQVINDTTVTVRKLYYFNIPFLVYYSPIRNLYLGAGLQFSNLSNGIAFQNNIVHHVGGSSLTDTVTTSTVISLKENRPAYNNLRKTDWRAIFEMNYYWKRITLGLQYQQALGNYLYTPVEGSSGRDRNSSFNIYLRYNLWERRIKITPKKITSRN